MLSVTLADLRYRYRQFLIAVVGAGVVLAMAVLMSGLAAGFRVEIHDTIKAVSADRWLMSDKSNGRITAVATFDQGLVQRVAATPGVTAANGIAFLPDEVLRSGSTPVTANVMGVGSGPLGQPGARSGHGLTAAGQMVVGTRAHIRLGSTVLLGSTPFHVVGTIGDRSLGAGIPMVYIQLADAQRALFGGQPVVTAVVTNGVPAHVPSGLTALTSDQVVDSTLETLAGGVESIKNARVLMWVVAVIIVAALIYVSALQRVRDFAVLKALGSSSAMLFASLCLQAVIVTMLAAVTGVALSTMMTGIFQQTIDVPASAYYTLPLIAIGVGVGASLVALRRATGADPVAAFGGDMTTLTIENLTVEFVSSGYTIRPFRDLSFSAKDGHLVVLLGPSGCGKTTLLSCLAGLLTPTAGSIRLDDLEVSALRGSKMSRYRRSTVGVVFQAFNLIPSLSARSNVMVPLRLAGQGRSKARERAEELLGQVDLSERLNHRPSRLSGGQQQRVAIARALAHDPPLVIADEPTAHLDYIQVEGVLRLIRAIAAPGRLVVVATHDERITKLADAVVELTAQRAVSVVAEPFTVQLEPGQMLFEQGDASDFVYVVESGGVQLFRELADGGMEVLMHVDSGGYFGELGPMLNLPRSASARATEASVLTGYGIAQFRGSHAGRA